MNKKYVNVSLSEELIEILEKTAEKLGQPISAIIRNSVLDYCRRELSNKNFRGIKDDD
jgi:hypothetical protein